MAARIDTHSYLMNMTFIIILNNSNMMCVQCISNSINSKIDMIMDLWLKQKQKSWNKFYVK